ncbi:MAG: TolC family protein [Anditalea sp.]
MNNPKSNIQHLKCLIFLLLMGFSYTAKPQSKLDELLSSVTNNNKGMIANRQYWEAQRLGFKTGLTPYNPSVEYEYLNGSPAGAGIQKDFTVTQAFDFPTAYFKKNALSEEQITQTNYQSAVFRQDILLRAKLYFLVLVYLNKQNQVLSDRLRNVEGLHTSYQRRLEVGEANILDVTKARIQFVNLQNELRRNESEIGQITVKLAELNGGVAVEVSGTVYPIPPDVPEYKVLDSLIEANDPVLKVVVQEKEISEKQVAVARSLTLPKIQTGYRSQSILGQSYRGVLLGVTIPLWENKNRIKQEKAEVLYSELQIQNHITEHQHKIRELYLQYENLKVSIAAYEELLGGVNTEAFLSKALELGEISTIDYFIELTYLYDAYDQYLLLENEYHKTIAKLYKYEL